MKNWRITEWFRGFNKGRQHGIVIERERCLRLANQLKRSRDSSPSFVTLCAEYTIARDAQLEHRDFHGGDSIPLVNETARCFDNLVKALSPWYNTGENNETTKAT